MSNKKEIYIYFNQDRFNYTLYQKLEKIPKRILKDIITLPPEKIFIPKRPTAKSYFILYQNNPRNIIGIFKHEIQINKYLISNGLGELGDKFDRTHCNNSEYVPKKRKIDNVTNEVVEDKHQGVNDIIAKQKRELDAKMAFILSTY